MEHIVHQEQNQEHKHLTPEMQKVLDNAIFEIKNNPEMQKAVKEDFSNLFEMLAQNPETAAILDAKVTDKMNTELTNIKNQHAQGEIYSEEARENSKQAILQATIQRLQIFATQNNFQIS